MTGGYITPRQATQGEKLYIDESKGAPVQDVWMIFDPFLAHTRRDWVTPLKSHWHYWTGSSKLVQIPMMSFSIHSAGGNNYSSGPIASAQWIGIDICVNACKVIEKRLSGHFDSLWDDVQFIGMPKTRDDAKTLADLDKFRFERWAASLVDGMEANKRQRGDKGIDGRGRFPIRKGQFIDIVSQVKGGGTSPGDVQAFNGARQQAEADLGVFTCFEERVTTNMRNAATSAGRFMGSADDSDLHHRRFLRGTKTGNAACGIARRR